MNIRLLPLLLFFFILIPIPTSAEVVQTTRGRVFDKVESIADQGGTTYLTLANRGRFKLSEVVKVEFPQRERKGATDLPMIALTNGDRLRGPITKGTTLNIEVGHTGAGSFQVSLDYLRAIFYLEHIKSTTQRQKFIENVLKNSPKRDIVYLKKGGQIPCVVQKILPNKITFQVSGVGKRTLSTDEILAVRIAPLGGPFRRGTGPYTKVYLKDGSILSGPISRYENDQLYMKFVSGKEISIPYVRLAEIYFFGGSFVYLSDLKPSEVVVNPGIAGISGLKFPPQFDLNVVGKPLRTRDSIFRKGLGLHSKTKITFDVNQKYRRFQATAGFDDSAREANTAHVPKVVVRVYGDGKKLYDSNVITPTSPLKALRLNISSVKKLTIEVDYGEPYDDVLGRLNLVDPFLVKK